ncbi:MAG: LCP family protein [Bacilli bacterium]|nr:LCP family protein [Bacilli bacterium]MDD3305355.1 LCP family protein [Bacilli bacterium]MDD4053373.1 LCP family protein [Bacilli bacterium]MDD4410980.1 LCP family protein [Bacilli bacterium]
MSRKNKSKSKNIRNIILVVLGLFSISSLYLIYNIYLLSGIENFIRTGIIIFLGLIILFFLIGAIKAIKHKKPKEIIIFITVALLIGSLEFLGAVYINKAYTSISKMNKTEVTYSSSLITLVDSDINDVSDLKNKKIGIINDTSSIEGYIISQEIITENKINKDSLEEYDDFLSMLNDLYEKDIDALFISSSYASMFNSIDGFSNIKSETKIILSKEKTMAKQDDRNINSGVKITKPFTMLVMGIDSTGENIKNATSFNGDTLILITFNPKTLNATMMSIPRDTFVPIMCFKNQIQNKITHAAWYGESCMIDTIENFTGINIDYYVKINFKGVVNLVDTVGGIEIDVPYSFCEQNSNREWGKNTIYVKKGLQTINGEQALALSRNRDNNKVCGKEWSSYYSSDLIRGQNQQLVIKSLANKFKEIRDVNKVYEVLNLVEKNMDTNLTTNQILSFYDIGKKMLENSKTDGDILNFQKLYLSTYGAMIYDEGMKRPLSNQIYYKGSLNDIVNAMNINLGIKDPVIIKDFTFSINEPYEEQVIGKGKYNEAAIPLVPDFTKNSQQYAVNWGLKNNIPINFNTVESNNLQYSAGQITNQSVHAKSLVSLVSRSKGITLTIIKKTSNNITTDRIDCTKEDNKDDKLCIIPDFRGKTINDVTAWQKKITTDSITINKKGTETDIEDDANKVTFQTESSIGKNIYNLSNRTISIEYDIYVEPTKGEPEASLDPEIKEDEEKEDKDSTE